MEGAHLHLGLEMEIGEGHVDDAHQFGDRGVASSAVLVHLIEDLVAARWTHRTH